MIGYLGLFVVVLAAALAVFVLAGVLTSDRPDVGRGLNGFWSDLRAGLRSLGRGGAQDGPVADADEALPGRGADANALAAEEELSMDDFFSGVQQDGDAYVQADDITATLERARAAVVAKHHEHQAARAHATPNVPATSSHQAEPDPHRPRTVAGHVPASSQPADPSHHSPRYSPF